MGYADYGAFVYRDGVRQPDCEDCQVVPTERGQIPDLYHAVLGRGLVRLACDRLRLHLFVGGAEVDLGPYGVEERPRGCDEAWAGEIYEVRFIAYRYATSIDLYLCGRDGAWTANCGVGRGSGFEDE